jgi:hypothetical protein
MTDSVRSVHSSVRPSGVGEDGAVMESGCGKALQGTYSRSAIENIMPRVLMVWQMSPRLPRETTANGLEIELAKRSLTEVIRFCHMHLTHEGFRSFQEHLDGT